MAKADPASLFFMQQRAAQRHRVAQDDLLKRLGETIQALERAEREVRLGGPMQSLEALRGRLAHLTRLADDYAHAQRKVDELRRLAGGRP